ncbi:hypothetical protein ABID92_002463 [Frigoribacterium sp. PvP120]|uniref:hypothetical protein n=1 Tax=unclassified Frigoribacterium TaxID=2627005 RepID=UPI001AE4EECC|nr:hypothetical protein [Frigoribacterium sp. PvP121]MBP1242290.1 hypothetical protein [Frigoribacterium sp. PvP121]
MTEHTQDGAIIVRLFPDHAGTVIWSGGPAPYDEAGLSSLLEADLRAWEAFHRARPDPDLAPHAPDDEDQFATTGVALATGLANELGNRFEVHLIHRGREVLRSTEPPTNPGAARALRTRARRQAAEARAVVEKLGGGAWLAYSPASGNRFYPGRGAVDAADVGPDDVEVRDAVLRDAVLRDPDRGHHDDDAAAG